MKISIYILSFIFLFTFGCKKGSTSGKIISEETMILILTDIHIAEAGIVIERHNSDSFDQIATDYYQAIFQKYNVNTKQFVESYNYYMKKPEKLQKIYEKINETLGVKDSEQIDE